MTITRDDSQQANQIAQDLADTYGVTVQKDWGEQDTEAGSRRIGESRIRKLGLLPGVEGSGRWMS
jgi:hypothetical protein